MGRSVADTRSAMTTLMNYGMSLNETETNMKAVSGLAATMGTSQEQAASTLVRAMEGQGRALKVLGLNVSDFKDANTGAIDKQKLLQAVMEKTSGSAEAFANTFEGKVQKFNNSVAAIKTDFGKFLIDALTPLIPVVQQVLNVFNGLPGPLKTATFAVMGLVAAFGLLAGPIKSVLELTMMMDVTGMAGGAAGEGGMLTKIINKIGVGKGSGAAATAAAAEAEVASVGLSGLAASISTMLVPLLAISAVVAVMIPIIAGLAAEAIVFAKGIQMVIQAMHFEKIDLSGAINGIKQIGEALTNLAGVMVSMSLVSVTSTIALVLTVFSGGLLSIAAEIEVLKKVIPKLNEFKNVGKIDEGAIAAIKSIAEGLAGLQKATSALGDLSLE